MTEAIQQYERPAQLSKAVDLSCLNKEQVNELFHHSSGERRIVRRALGKQTVGKQIPHEVLCKYWSKSLESKLGRMLTHQSPQQVMTLCDLWGQILFDDNKTPMLTTQRICQAVFNLRNGMAPDYDS